MRLADLKAGYFVLAHGGGSEGFTTLALIATLPGLALDEGYGFEVIERVQIPLPDATSIAGASMRIAIRATAGETE